MIRTRLLILAVFAALAFSACSGSISFGRGIEATGELVTVPFDVEEFESIDVSNTFEAFVEVGESTSVEVVVNESLVDELDIRVRNGELKIGLKNGVSVRNGTLEATVQIPSLEAIDVSGASETEVIGLAASSLHLDVSGSSDLTITGVATTVNVDASGASNVDLQLDDVDAVIVDLSGASSLDLQTAEHVRGDMSGASSLLVPVDAEVRVDTSGSSSVSRR